MMQQMTGLEFQQILRAYDISLPVIFLSGHGTVPAASPAFKGGAVDFLMKPVHSEELIAAVSDAIAKHANTLIAEERARSVGARYSQLTPREREVCSLLTQGLLNNRSVIRLAQPNQRSRSTVYLRNSEFNRLKSSSARSNL
jgi:FixJ family two-component response regulator